MYDLLEHKQKVYSANKVYITMSSGVCQAHTRIEAQCVLESITSVVHSDSNIMSTRIRAQCALGLELKGVIKLGYKHNVYLD
jgi:hypothetical protein